MIKTDTWMLGGGWPPVRFISEGQFINQEELFAQIKGGTDITPSLAYAKVVWAYRCVNLRAMTIGGLPWRILNKKQEEVEWPLAEKLAEVIPLVEYALCIWGASYVLKQANRVKLGGLQWLNPATMKPVSNPASGVTGFEQRLPGKEQAPNKFAPEQVIYHRLFNPDDDLGPGVSPMAAALSPAGLAKNANTFAEKFFENGAIPSVIFTTEQNIPDQEIERIREWWGRLQSGVRNAWKTAIMRNGLKPETIGSPIKDLVLGTLFQEARSQIAVAFGIPQTLLEDAANYACLPGDQLVYTPNGPVPIAKLEQGDVIWQHTDSGIVMNQVVEIIPQGLAPVYQIKTPHRTLRASENHPILTVSVIPGRGPYDLQRASLVWKRADQLNRGDLLVSVEELPDQGQSEIDGLALTEEFMELAGLYIGDGDGGDRMGLRFAIPEGPLQDYYASTAERVFQPSCTLGESGQGRNRAYGKTRSRKRHYVFVVGSKRAYRLYEALRLTGSARSKRVPKWVYGLSLSLRLAFLRGYLDSDGTVGKDGRMVFGACNKDLIHDVRALLVSCGIPVSNVLSDVGRIGNKGPIEVYRFICGYPEYNRAVGSHDERYIKRLAHEGRGSRDGRYVPGSTAHVWNLRLPPGMGIERVASVELIGDEPVFDLVTTGTHTFIAEGIVVHNTAKEHKLSFYYETVFPEARLIANGFNRQLFTPYGLTFEFCFNEVEAIQQDESSKAAAVVMQFEKGLLEKWEAREILGHSAVAQPSPEVAALLAAEDADEGEDEEATESSDTVSASETPGQVAQTKALSDAAIQELAKWRRKAIRYWIQGKPERMGEWEAEAIPAERVAQILDGLIEAECVDEVKLAFDSDAPMESYRRVPRARKNETPTKEEIDKAIADWDKTMPEYAGMLDAQFVKAGKK